MYCKINNIKSSSYFENSIIYLAYDLNRDQLKLSADYQFLKVKKDLFILTRVALQNCLKMVDQTTNWPIDKIEIQNHQHLLGHQHVLSSISHTKNLGIALIDCTQKYLSVGIDIEYKNRPLDPSSKKYFINHMDKTEYNYLSIWTIKEAAYKAIWPLRHIYYENQKILLKHIWINDNQEFGLIGQSDILGHFTSSIIEANKKDIILSMAYLK